VCPSQCCPRRGAGVLNEILTADWYQLVAQSRRLASPRPVLRGGAFLARAAGNSGVLHNGWVEHKNYLAAVPVLRSLDRRRTAVSNAEAISFATRRLRIRQMAVCPISGLRYCSGRNAPRANVRGQ